MKLHLAVCTHRLHNLCHHIKEKSRLHSGCSYASHNHTAVKSVIPCFSGRHYLDFRRQKIVLFYIILFFENIQYICFYGVLRLLFLILRFKRNTANQDVQIFSFNYLGSLLIHLLGRKVD